MTSSSGEDCAACLGCEPAVPCSFMPSHAYCGWRAQPSSPLPLPRHTPPQIILAYAGVHQTHNVLPVFVFDLSLRDEPLLLDGALQVGMRMGGGDGGWVVNSSPISSSWRASYCCFISRHTRARPPTAPLSPRPPQAAAFPGMVIAVASRAAPVRTRFSCGHMPRSLQPEDATRAVLGAVLQSGEGRRRAGGWGGRVEPE